MLYDNVGDTGRPLHFLTT